MTEAHTLTGFRRRVLIEPTQGRVTAELEDDWHRMVVSLVHDGTTVQRVEADMKRWPWTACRGAIAVAETTFTGQPVVKVGRSELRTSNCTHLYDLGLFAAAHAAEDSPVAYDIGVTDPVDGRRVARILRNGEEVMAWTLEGANFILPEALAGRTLFDMNAWVAELAPRDQEAARILRWASILAQGRGMEIPGGLEATAYPAGACFNFQPEVAKDSRRKDGAHVDFDAPGAQPMADRAAMFPAG